MSPEGPRSLVLLVAGEALARLRLAGLLQEANLAVLPVASGEEAFTVLRAVPGIRALVVDATLTPGGMTGLELARNIGEEHGIGSVVLLEQAGPELENLPSSILFLSKPIHNATLGHLVHHLVETHQAPDQVPSPVEAASQGLAPAATAHSELTRRQREILDLLKQGKSNRHIARALSLSENTVKAHLMAVYRTLGVSSRVEAAFSQG